MLYDLHLVPMGRVAAEEVITWRYPPPYDFYNLSEDPAMLLAIFTDPTYGYFELRAGAALVGFCCFGAESRVQGGDYTAPALDVGIAIHPDHTGRGYGRAYMGAVLAFGSHHFQPPAFRLTVATFNLRARRLYIALGFRTSQRFTSPISGQEYVVMLREPMPLPPPCPSVPD